GCVLGCSVHTSFRPLGLLGHLDCWWCSCILFRSSDPQSPHTQWKGERASTARNNTPSTRADRDRFVFCKSVNAVCIDRNSGNCASAHLMGDVVQERCIP